MSVIRRARSSTCPSGRASVRPSGSASAARPASGDERVPIRDWVDAGRPTRVMGVDSALIWVTAALLAFGPRDGLFGVGRAARQPALRALHAHALPAAARRCSSLIGLVCAFATAQVPIAVWEKWAPWIFALAMVLLFLVLIPHIGKGVNGARRWIPLGLLNFQPSELAKLGMCMYAASYMVRKMDVKENFIKAVWPMAVALGVIGVLLLAEPDMGAFMVIAAIALGILFLGGVNGRMFLLSVAVLLGAFVLMIVFSEFRRQRIFAYLDPWNPTYAQGKAYQLTHSLIAFGRGEIFGQGLGARSRSCTTCPRRTPTSCWR